MKWLAQLTLLTVAFAGCSGKTTDDKTTEKTPPRNSNIADTGSQQTRSESGVDEATAQLMAQIDSATKSANQAQMIGDLDLAKQYWQTAENLLLERFGAKAWQTKSATLARTLAEEQCALGTTQRQKLGELLQQQQKIATSLANNDAVTGLKLSLVARQQCEQLFSKDSVMLAKQKMQLARMEQLNQHFEQAIDLFRESRSIQINILGEIHPDIEMIYGFMGECFIGMESNLPAIENMKEATRIAQSLWGESSLKYAKRANDLGVAFHKMHDLTTALKILRGAETVRRNELGMDHPLVAHSLYNLGAVYVDLQRNELAKQCFEQALPTLTSSLGEENLLVIDCQTKLAMTQILVDDLAGAEQNLGSVLATCQRIKAAPQTIANCQFRLAVAQARQKKYESAEPLLTEALATQKSILGESNPTTIRTYNALATVYQQTNRAAQAQELMRDVKPVSYQTNNSAFSSDESFQR